MGAYEFNEDMREFLLQCQASPLDLRHLSAEHAAKAFFEFLQTEFNPGSECWIFSPSEGNEAGCGPFWRVVWESGPFHWGTNLTDYFRSIWWLEFDLQKDLQRPEVLLNYNTTDSWYARSHYWFDVGFIDDPRNEPPFVGSIWHEHLHHD